MAQLDTSAVAVALRQLVILERGFPVATKIIVGGEQLDVQNAPALLDEILGLETSWQAQLNTQPRNDSSHTHVIAAFERLNVPFLSGWEAAEVEIRDALAAGEFDDLATWRDEASGSSSDLWLVTMLGGNEGAAKAKALVAGDDAADAWDRWLVDGKLDKKSTKELRDRFANAKGPLETRPVKTHEKIDRQIGAYLAIAYCYHPDRRATSTRRRSTSWRTTSSSIRSHRPRHWRTCGRALCTSRPRAPRRGECACGTSSRSATSCSRGSTPRRAAWVAARPRHDARDAKRLDRYFFGAPYTLSICARYTASDPRPIDARRSSTCASSSIGCGSRFSSNWVP